MSLHNLYDFKRHFAIGSLNQSLQDIRQKGQVVGSYSPLYLFYTFIVITTFTPFFY